MQLILGDHEQRAIIQPQSFNDPLVKELLQVLMDWINDELADQRIIVKNVEEDLYDGQVNIQICISIRIKSESRCKSSRLSRFCWDFELRSI